MRRFPNRTSLVGFAGVNPGVAQSGMHEAKSVPSTKRGSPHLRKTLFLIVSVYVQHSLIIFANYLLIISITHLTTHSIHATIYVKRCSMKGGTDMRRNILVHSEALITLSLSVLTQFENKRRQSSHISGMESLNA